MTGILFFGGSSHQSQTTSKVSYRVSSNIKSSNTSNMALEGLYHGHGIALFDTKEVSIGRKLGSGGFCNVFEVTALRANEDTVGVEELTSSQRAARAIVAEQTKNKTVYAVKFLKPDLSRNQKLVRVASRDLETETKVLSILNHPNIISLKGCSIALNEASNETTNKHFLIMDRLDETLSDRMYKWKMQADALDKGLAGKLGLNRRRKKQLLLERLHVATEIGSALEYLHSNRIIYRDLKGQNIGFEAKTGRPKLFDMGLTRFMPEDTNECNDTYKMSGNCGTFRYMPPEVALKLPYNETADVYSFSHLLWRMLKLERLYDGYTKHDHRERVVKGGERPWIDPRWPKGIQEILPRAWSSDIQERPSMTEMIAVLEDAVDELESGRSSSIDNVNNNDGADDITYVGKCNSMDTTMDTTVCSSVSGSLYSSQ